LPLRLVGTVLAVLAVATIAPLYIAERYLTQSYASANPEMALTGVERAQRFNPVDPDLRQREAELALQVGDWPRAEDAYRSSIRLNPEHYAPYVLLARFYEERGELEKALSLYREALSLNPLDEELNQRVERLEAETADPT
jgi:tetratricopeptide (TPR) repeat protein